jgi:hypothetical protein
MKVVVRLEEMLVQGRVLEVRLKAGVLGLAVTLQAAQQELLGCW